MFDVTVLKPSLISSITGACANAYDSQCNIVPAWKRGMSNLVTNSGSGAYDGGDRVIGFGALNVDGDLLITAGWGDGAAIRRLNNDGTMTKLWHVDYALYRDTASTYNHINSLAIHKPSSQIALATHNVNGYSMIDYSSLKTGGTTVVNNRPSSQYIFSNGVNVDRAGNAYTSGLVTAGDWLYIGDYDATHYKKFPRRHWTTGVEELIDGTNASYIETGTNTIDRNGYRYTLMYDEVNDRVFYFSYYNGNFMMIINASTANPKCVWCDMGDAGMGDDAYEQGLFIPDPVNSPNLLTIGCNSRHAYVDITPCFSNNKPTVLKQFYTEDQEKGAQYSVYFRAGTNWQSTSGDACDKNPTYPDFHVTSSDRGRNMLDGWIDYDNSRIVGLERHDTVVEDTTTGGRGRSYRSDYSNPVFRMQSANGTYYWIKTGYGYDGHSFKVWDASVGNGLIGNWSVEYDIPTWYNDIKFAKLLAYDHYVPSGCSLTYFISNNNGSTWEACTPNTTHEFSSTGRDLKVKYVATGFTNKAPYKVSNDLDIVGYSTEYESVRDITIKPKISRYKIRGRK